MDVRRAQVHFVVSAPRSGSTWLQRALNSHPDIFCTEQRLFGAFCELWPEPDGRSEPRITLDKYIEALTRPMPAKELGLPRPMLQSELQNAVIDTLLRFAFSYSDKPVLVDKITPYLHTSDHVLEEIGAHFPDSQVIQLVRDGRDVATSGAFDWLRKDAQGTDRYAFFVEQRPGMRLERFFDDQTIERWAGYWSQPIAAFARLRPKAPLIRYEQMKADLVEVLGRLTHQVGAQDDRALLQRCAEAAAFQHMSGGRRAGDGVPTAKTRKGIVGDWRNHFTRRDGELFHDLAGEQLVAMGYEKDGSWVEQLPEALDLTHGPVDTEVAR